MHKKIKLACFSLYIVCEFDTTWSEALSPTYFTLKKLNKNFSNASLEYFFSVGHEICLA